MPTSRFPWRLAAIAAAVTMTVATARGQIAASYASTLSGYALTKVADGVYAFLAPDSKTPFVTSNSLAVIGRDGVLVVDPGHVPALTRRMIADIRRLTDKPVQYVVNTHWHPDHVVGNGEYLAAFPHVVVVSTAETRAQIEAHIPSYASDLAAQVPGGLEKLRQLLKAGAKPDGTTLTADDREFYDIQIREYEGALPAVSEMTYAPPTLTFDRELTVDLGQRQVRVLFLGRGNTAGDAVVYVPDARVVATGDLVVAPVPYATASFMLDWPETMNRLMALEATAIVPGHGPLMHDWAYARQIAELVSSIANQATAAVKDGLTLEDARKRIDLSAARQRLAGSDQFQRRIFDQFFLPGAVERAYREATFRAEK